MTTFDFNLPVLPALAAGNAVRIGGKAATIAKVSRSTVHVQLPTGVVVAKLSRFAKLTDETVWLCDGAGNVLLVKRA